MQGSHCCYWITPTLLVFSEERGEEFDALASSSFCRDALYSFASTTVLALCVPGFDLDQLLSCALETEVVLRRKDLVDPFCCGIGDIHERDEKDHGRDQERQLCGPSESLGRNIGFN